MKQFYTIYHIIIAVIIGYILCHCLLKDKETFVAYNPTTQDAQATQVPEECPGNPPPTRIDKNLQSNKCNFKNTDCKLEMSRRGSDHWSFHGESENNFKKNCKMCVSTSTLENVLVRNIADLSQEFASRKCDAIEASCDGSDLYANAKVDWTNGCPQAGDNKIKQAICKIHNPALQWILELFRPRMCDAKIMAIKIKRGVTEAWDKLMAKVDKLNPFS